MGNIPLFTIHPRWLAGFLPSTVLPFTTRYTWMCCECWFFANFSAWSWCFLGDLAGKKSKIVVPHKKRTQKSDIPQIHQTQITGFWKHPKNGPTCWWPKLLVKYDQSPLHRTSIFIMAALVVSPAPKMDRFETKGRWFIGLQKTETRWWFRIFLCSPLFGEDSHFD